MENHESKWLQNIEKAKSYVKQIKVIRMDIAKLAVEVCDFPEGRIGKPVAPSLYTLVRFAREAGLNYKTLAEWVRVYKNVASKLPDKAPSPTLQVVSHEDIVKTSCETVENNYMAAWRTCQKTKKDTPPEVVREIFTSEVNRGSDSFYLVQLLKRVRTGRYFICKKADLSTLDLNELRELSQHCTKISSFIIQFLEFKEQQKVG